MSAIETPYRVRTVTLEDVPTLVHHRHAMFAEMGTNGDYLTMDEEFGRWVSDAMKSGIYYGWLAVTKEDEVAAGGGASLLPWPPHPRDRAHRIAYVYNVYTEPAHRHKGLARTLMNVIHAWCLERGVRTVALHASELGRPLYESIGYRPTNEMRLSLE